MQCVLSIIQFSEADLLSGCLKNLLYSREQYIVVSLFSFVSSGCLTRRLINVARIVLLKSKQSFFR